MKGKVKSDVDNSEKYIKILKGTFINVRCDNIRVENGTRRIIVWGIMESVATKEESDKANIENETDDLQYTEYETYIETNENEYEQENVQDDENALEEN